MTTKIEFEVDGYSHSYEANDAYIEYWEEYKDADDLLVNIAEYYFHDCDGWENWKHSEKKFTVWYEDGRLIGKFVVDIEFIPNFNVYNDTDDDSE